MTPTDTTTMRNKLAERAQNTGTDLEAAPVKRDAPAVIVRKAIERQSTAFQAVLPKTVDPHRFGRLVLTAVKAAPELMQCFATAQGETSVLLSAMQAAAIGLEPNTPTQDCWLLPRKNHGTWECQLSIGYRGYMKLARRSGTIKTIFAEVVRERDHFRWERGLETDVLEHRPYDGDDDPGEMTHAYAVARYTNGGYSFMILNRRQVEQRRAMSDSWRNEKARPYSPWTKWPEAMWRKSAVRALVPYLDLEAEVEQQLVTDEARLRIDTDEGVIDVDPNVEDDTPALGAPSEEIDPTSGAEAPGPDGREESEPSAASVGQGEEDGSASVTGPSSEPDGLPAQPEFDVDGDGQGDELEPMSDKQHKALHALLRQRGATGDDRFPILSDLLGREITTTKDISRQEASVLIDTLQAGEGGEQ